MVGRKALVNHLKKSHDAVNPDGFSFDPRIDMPPGHLACKHCYTTFTMDLALKTHFQRASCPVLVSTWTRNQRFGDLALLEPQEPVVHVMTSGPIEPFGSLGL